MTCTISNSEKQWYGLANTVQRLAISKSHHKMEQEQFQGLRLCGPV